MAFIRNIEKDEKCYFCLKIHSGFVLVTNNSGAYTSMYNIPYCEDHKEAAMGERKRVQSLPGPKGHFWD